MSILPGIYASQITGHLVTTAYDSIATVNVSSTVSSVSFTSIPSTYKHLQIRYLARSTRTGFTSDSLLLQFNSDTATNYNYHRLYGDGSTVTSDATTSSSNIYISQATAANATSGMFAGGVLDILDYADTNKNKTTRTLSGNDQNGSGLMFLNSGLWRSTSAITSIVITPQSGSHAQYSSFALYGIKG